VITFTTIGIHQNQYHHVFSPRGVALNPSLAEVCEANGSNSSAGGKTAGTISGLENPAENPHVLQENHL
jgi:hypothetical protein